MLWTGTLYVAALLHGAWAAAWAAWAHTKTLCLGFDHPFKSWKLELDFVGWEGH